MSTDEAESITELILELKAGDDAAAGLLWERYFDRLVRLARDRLRSARWAGRDRDEEDVALSVFDRFCRDARDGRYPHLRDRDDLWRLLVRITACRAVDEIKRRAAQRRGAGRVIAEADLGDDDRAGLSRVIGAEPSPEFAAMVVEESGLLLARLGDEGLRRVALLKLAGHTNEEIRRELGCSLRTVVLRLAMIRKIWRPDPEEPL